MNGHPAINLPMQVTVKQYAKGSELESSDNDSGRGSQNTPTSHLGVRTAIFNMLSQTDKIRIEVGFSILMQYCKRRNFRAVYIFANFVQCSRCAKI